MTKAAKFTQLERTRHSAKTPPDGHLHNGPRATQDLNR